MTSLENAISSSHLNPNGGECFTCIPNRIFVGGISGNSSDIELKGFFSDYGNVQDCRIVRDRNGISKGYGFVTFARRQDADALIKKEGSRLIFKERRLNIGPAVRRQNAGSKHETSQVSAATVASNPQLSTAKLEPTVAAPEAVDSIYYSCGVPYSYRNGVAIFNIQPTMLSGYFPQMTPGYGPVLVAQQQYSPGYQTTAMPVTYGEVSPSTQWVPYSGHHQVPYAPYGSAGPTATGYMLAPYNAAAAAAASEAAKFHHQVRGYELTASDAGQHQLSVEACGVSNEQSYGGIMVEPTAVPVADPSCCNAVQIYTVPPHHVATAAMPTSSPYHGMYYIPPVFVYQTVQESG